MNNPHQLDISVTSQTYWLCEPEFIPIAPGSAGGFQRRNGQIVNAQGLAQLGATTGQSSDDLGA